jgi:SAM-dependent methyltransferase
MVKIYRDYADEPADTFLPLPEKLACDLYRLEMDGFQEDIAFYRSLLPESATILEMGCGTGRVARKIAGKYRPVTGIDISLPMLRQAAREQSANCRFCCMDMTAIGFRRSFDTILIPYNTLNLLVEEDRILNCLAECLAALHASGKIILQLFVPAADFMQHGRTTFQFQLFDRPGGGRIIKEILKKPQPGAQAMEIEERFRIRPMQQGLVNEDYHSIYRIAAFSLNRWLLLFARAGFAPENIWGSYDRQPFDRTPSSCCLLLLGRK